MAETLVPMALPCEHMAWAAQPLGLPKLSWLAQKHIYQHRTASHTSQRRIAASAPYWHLDQFFLHHKFISAMIAYIPRTLR